MQAGGCPTTTARGPRLPRARHADTSSAHDAAPADELRPQEASSRRRVIRPSLVLNHGCIGIRGGSPEPLKPHGQLTPRFRPAHCFWCFDSPHLPYRQSTGRSAMKILVIGGSGLIGSKLVRILRQRGYGVTPASPSTGVNTVTGEGLAEALRGVQIVVDVANSPSFED